MNNINNKFVSLLYSTKITREDRHRLNGHKSCVLWFTGLPGAGKSTLAAEVEKKIYQRQVRSYVLDGDNIRLGLNNDLGFSPRDRRENIRRVGEVSKMFMDAGLFVLVSFISPYEKNRALVRSLFRPGDYVEIHVKCLLEVCEQRDPKGLYRQARLGMIKNFTGLTAPYETPLNPELTIETDKQTPEACTKQIISYLEDNGYLISCST